MVCRFSERINDTDVDVEIVVVVVVDVVIVAVVGDDVFIFVVISCMHILYDERECVCKASIII